MNFAVKMRETNFCQTELGERHGVYLNYIIYNEISSWREVISLMHYAGTRAEERQAVV